MTIYYYDIITNDSVPLYGIIIYYYDSVIL